MPLLQNMGCGKHNNVMLDAYLYAMGV